MTRLLAGINHIAILTQDLNRFVDFYSNVFGADVVFTEAAPGFRHAILRVGDNAWLHPAQVTGNAHSVALPGMFKRGHLDHIALTASSPEAFDIMRQRLITRGATDGAIEDLGAFHSLWFEDPDDMRAELVVIVDPLLKGIHGPRPLRSEAH